MPAKSKAQHGIMGMALAYKRGKLKAADIPSRIRNKVKQIASSMSDAQLRDFTKTKTKKLPKHRVRKVRSS
jgi:hypothetical protein